MTSAPYPRRRWRAGVWQDGARDLPEEVAVALVHDASTTAVMMATPADLEDFAVGFSLTEGLVSTPDDITGIEIAPGDLGVEVRMWLRTPASAALAARRRRMAGPTGCGLCGIDSLSEAAQPPRRVPTGLTVSPATVQRAVAGLAPAQALGAATRAAHAAAWWTDAGGIVALREDVGRHNALDKLAGTLARTGVATTDGLLLLTSRVSVEMVQKAAAMGAQVLVAVSAPTSLAVRTAEAAGMTLVAVARDDGFEVFTGAERIVR